jgi:hypothetical protein
MHYDLSHQELHRRAVHAQFGGPVAFKRDDDLEYGGLDLFDEINCLDCELHAAALLVISLSGRRTPTESHDGSISHPKLSSEKTAAQAGFALF